MKFQANQSVKIVDAELIRNGEVGVIVAENVDDQGEPGGDLVSVRVESEELDGSQVIEQFEPSSLVGL